MTNSQNENTKELAGFRSNIYGFLAAVYRQELTSELLQQMKDHQFQEILSTLGIELSNGFFKKPEKELLENLAVEYAYLFLGPGKHISPHESVHHSWGPVNTSLPMNPSITKKKVSKAASSGES
jgi:TorA maturation chaperone TorD